MNKSKKIAAAVVSLVLAGTMITSLAACDNGGKKPDGGKKANMMTRFEGFMNDAWQTSLKGYGSETSASSQTKLTPTNENGKLKYAANTTLNTAIGYDDKGNTGIVYKKSDDITAMQTYLKDTGLAFNLYGESYTTDDLKPAWHKLSETLQITIKDDFQNKGSGDQMSAITGALNGLSSHQVFTASASDINLQGASGNLLNITDYLDYMPNYKAFLDANPLARLSLTADEHGSMYMLPYFDGNDDIEKYVLLEKNLVSMLLDTVTLDSSKTVTFKEQAEAKKAKDSTKGIVATSSSVESFMGKTGSWEVETTDPAALDDTKNPSWGSDLNVAKKGQENAVVKVVVNYDAALTAAKDTTKGLGKAISDVAGKAYNGESGNIVDLQNFVINEKSGVVEGSDLLNILREYIKVAYQTKTGGQFYTKLSDVFNSAYAAWDVDLYVALGRCFTTCGGLLTGKGGSLVKDAANLYLLSGREWKSQRYSDTYSMVGELYGVRGLETRYSPTFAYINAEGKISDSRLDVKTWEALDKMNKLAKEGLYNSMTENNLATKAGWSSGVETENNGIQTLTLHDYVQTQTANIGFRKQTGGENASTYNFAPVLTPVSHWDTTGNGETDTTMRFTESWRGVKNTGWCISYDGVKSDPDKLAASLALVDYFFSNDGQILMTYGPQGDADDDGTAAAAKLATGGFWYGDKVTTGTVGGVTLAYGSDGALTAKTLEDLVTAKVLKTNDDVQYSVTSDYEASYFVYNNALYTGTLYKGRQIPVLTKSSLAMFENGTLGNHSFTNYARWFIGSALNIGNKDQGFEYQCTPKCGIVGADIVNVALVNGTIKHTLQISPAEAEANNNWWYMLTPTMLPYDSRVTPIINEAPYTIVTALNSKETTLFKNNSSNDSTNLLIDVMAYGIGSGHVIRGLGSRNEKIPDSAAAIVEYLDTISK